MDFERGGNPKGYATMMLVLVGKPSMVPAYFVITIHEIPASSHFLQMILLDHTFMLGSHLPMF